MTEAMMDVGSIRFTQEHVYDSFNANSAKAGGVVELIEGILSGKKTPRDLPLIRVAPKRGAYWCVDNRRLFVYKHCQLGEIPVEVYGWKDMREFELKWRNGLATRSQTSEGRRVGVIQRTDVPFPRSPIAEKTLSKISLHLSPAQQRSHEASIAALGRRRKREAKSSAAGVGGGDDKEAAAASLLRSLVGGLAPPLASKKADDSGEEPDGEAANVAATAGAAAGRKKKGKRRKSAEGSPVVAAVAEGQTLGRGQTKRKKRKGGREAAEGAGDGAGDAGRAAAAGTPDAVAAAAAAPAASGKAKKTLKVGKEGRGRPPGASASPPAAAAAAPVASAAAAAPGGPVRLTVALAQEDSGDEAYDVELTAL